MAGLDLPPLESMTAQEARDFMTEANAARPPGPDVGEIVDGTLPGAAGDLDYRLYRPASPGPHPVVVYFHGGGWVLGSHDSDDPFCRDLCVRSDAVIVSVDYRHAPEARFPAAADDAFAAVQWIAAHAVELGGIPEQLVVAGWSAGGNLAAVVCQMARDAGGPAIVGQLLITPVTDCDMDTGSYLDNADGYVLTKPLMEWFWDHYVDAEQRTDPACSPLRAADLSGLPPALIVTCEFDPLRDEGHAYADALEAAGVPVTLLQARGHTHTSISMVDVILSGAPVRAPWPTRSSSSSAPASRPEPGGPRSADSWWSPRIRRRSVMARSWPARLRPRTGSPRGRRRVTRRVRRSRDRTTSPTVAASSQADIGASCEPSLTRTATVPSAASHRPIDHDVRARGPARRRRHALPATRREWSRETRSPARSSTSRTSTTLAMTSSTTGRILHVDQGQPRRRCTGVDVQQVGHHALHRRHDRAMDHHRPDRPLAVARRQVELAGEVEIDLDRRQRLLLAAAVADLEIDLRAVEGRPHPRPPRTPGRARPARRAARPRPHAQSSSSSTNWRRRRAATAASEGPAGRAPRRPRRPSPACRRSRLRWRPDGRTRARR